MTFSEVLNIVLPTFIVILIGYILGKTTHLDLTAVVEIVFYIGLPSLAFVSVMHQQILLLDAVKVWACSLIVMLGGGFIAWVVFQIKREKHSGLYLPIIIPNVVNIPFPIISRAYGAPGLFAATLYYIPTVILLYTLGVFVAAGKGWRDNLKAMLKVPTIYAAVLALVLNLNNVNVPPLVTGSLSFIGEMVVPLVVLMLGYNLSRVKLTSLPTTLLASFIRLGGGLALALLSVWAFNLTGVLRTVVIFDSAMPAAVNSYMVASKYRSEPELVASVILVTTVISLASIPFLLHVLG